MSLTWLSSTVLLVFLLDFVHISDCASLFNGKPRSFMWETGSYELGVLFYSQVAGVVTGVIFFTTNDTGRDPRSCALFHDNGTLLAQANGTAPAPDNHEDWQRCEFASPIRLNPHENYVAMMRTTKFVYSPYFWSPYGFDSCSGGVLVGIHARVFAYLGAIAFTYPTYSITNNYWVDVNFKQDTLSLPTELETTTSAAPTTAGSTAATSMLTSSSMSASPPAVSSTGSTASAGSLSAPSTGSDLMLIGVLVGVALFIQCVILVVATVLFVKWKRLRSSTPQPPADASRLSVVHEASSTYADASEVRQLSESGSNAAIHTRTHEYAAAADGTLSR
jgi:hypothetical protein